MLTRKAGKKIFLCWICVRVFMEVLGILTLAIVVGSKAAALGPQ